MFARMRELLVERVPVPPLVSIIDGYRCLWDYASSELGHYNYQIIDYASFDCYYNSAMNGHAIKEYALVQGKTNTYVHIRFTDHSRMVRSYLYEPDLHDRHLSAILESDFVSRAINKSQPASIAVQNTPVKKHNPPEFPSRGLSGFHRCAPRTDCYNCGRSEGLTIWDVDSRAGDEARQTYSKCMFCLLRMAFT